MQAAKLDEAGMKKLHADHEAAMSAGDVDAAMAFLDPDPEVHLAGLHMRGADAVRASKRRWLETWALRTKDRGMTFAAYDEGRQMAVFEGWRDSEMDDGTVERQWLAVAIEFENGLMKRERAYFLNPKMSEAIQRTHSEIQGDAT